MVIRRPENVSGGTSRRCQEGTEAALAIKAGCQGAHHAASNSSACFPS